MKLDKLIERRQHIPTNDFPIPTKELCERFEKLYTGDMHKDDPSIGKMRKPELLKFIMAELGVKSEDCTMVGDTINDFEAAQKNHIASVAVGWGYGTESERAQATRLARTPEEI